MKVNILILQSFWMWDHFKVTDFLFVWETLQNLKHIGGEDWKPFVISHFGTTVVQEQTRNTLQGSVAKALQDVSSSFLDYPYIFFFFSSLEGNQNSIRALYMPEILLSTSKYMAVVLAINCRVYFFLFQSVWSLFVTRHTVELSHLHCISLCGEAILLWVKLAVDCSLPGMWRLYLNSDSNQQYGYSWDLYKSLSSFLFSFFLW